MAFIVVSNVPRDYYQVIQGPLKNKMEKISFELPIENKKNSSKEIGWKLFGQLLTVLIFLFEVLYFHFMPYFAFIYRFFPSIINWFEYEYEYVKFYTKIS